jgi:hypothetical protein
MHISAPKPFNKIPDPRRDFTRPGRPRSEVFKALEALKVRQFIEIHVVPGKAPSLATLRASLPRWQRRLGREFNYRTDDNGKVFQIYRTK